MALTITNKCINYDVCEPECPNGAISVDPEVYVINPGECTECVGHSDELQYQQVYPVDRIPKDPTYKKAHDQLVQRYTQLTSAPPRTA